MGLVHRGGRSGHTERRLAATDGQVRIQQRRNVQVVQGLQTFFGRGQTGTLGGDPRMILDAQGEALCQVIFLPGRSRLLRCGRGRSNGHGRLGCIRHVSAPQQRDDAKCQSEE